MYSRLDSREEFTRLIRKRFTFIYQCSSSVYLNLLCACVLRADEVKSLASEMIGRSLVTKQTGFAGRLCSKVYIVQALDVAKEYYFAILFDRATRVRRSRFYCSILFVCG